MHGILRAFLGLYLAHLLTDFVFHSDRLKTQKTGRELWGYAKSGGLQFLIAILLLGLALPEMARDIRSYGIVLGLSLIHFGLASGKLYLLRSNTIDDGPAAFFLSQPLHGLAVCIAVWFIARPP